MTQPRSPNQEGDADQALTWLVRLESGDAEGPDWLAFTAWLEASPGHRAAFDRASLLWADLDDHAETIRSALDKEPLAPAVSILRPAPRVAAARHLRAWLVASAAVFVAAVAVLAPRYGARPPAQTTYQAEPGQRRVVVLSEGTRITLNGRSRMSISLSRIGRRAALWPGSEAAFDVHPDAARPFVIVAGDRRVRVIGTEFIVERSDGRLVITVRRGVVQVEPAGGVSDSAPTRLVAGEQLTHDEGATASEVQNVSPGAAFSWTSGRRVYQDAPLALVASELNRDLAIPIGVDARAGRLRFTGVLVIDNEDAVLGRLESLLPVVVERTPTSITLRGRARQTTP